MARPKGFYDHVRRNDIMSVAMFGGFALAFQLIAAVVLCLPLMLFDAEHAPVLAPVDYLWRYAFLMLALSVGLFLIGFAFHSDQVRSSVGFAFVERRTHGRLVNIVEQMAIAAGIALPKVGLIESSARNAFACGHSQASAVVVVTRGLVEALGDDELAAVIAHEITHIRNGDIRLMACANIMMNIVIGLEKFNPLTLGSTRRMGCMVMMPVVLLAVLFAGCVSKVAIGMARASRLVLSTSREYIADAEAVRLTHNPAALISALRKIEGRSQVDGVDTAVDAMMIDGLVRGPYATHPSIADRIAILCHLTGDMAHAPVGRRDTRPIEEAPQPRPAAGFGRKGLGERLPERTPEALGEEPVGEFVPFKFKATLDRMNEGPRKNVFGVGTRRDAHVMNMASMLMLIPIFLTIFLSL